MPMQALVVSMDVLMSQGMGVSIVFKMLGLINLIFFIKDRLGFLEQLHKEISAFVKHCEKGTSSQQ